MCNTCKTTEPVSVLTVTLIGNLLNWSDWKPWAEVYAPSKFTSYRMPLWNRIRDQVLMFEHLPVARITEYQMNSGVSQYTVSTFSGPKPPERFDSYGQALQFLKDAIEGRVS